MPIILNGSRNVHWSKWDAFLNDFFKFPSINKYHQFKYYPDEKLKDRLFADLDPEVFTQQLNTLDKLDAQVIEDIVCPSF